MELSPGFKNLNLRTLPFVFSLPKLVHLESLVQPRAGRFLVLVVRLDDGQAHGRDPFDVFAAHGRNESGALGEPVLDFARRREHRA